MADVLKPKVQATGLVDIALLGISKSITERALTPIVGNANPQSGLVKLVGGSLIQGRGKIGAAVGGGLVIDGIEDLVATFLGGMGGDSAVSEAW